VKGHWQPRSNVARRTGHQTPLICAAIYGHVEAVRLLLQAGADRDAKFDGQTALKFVKEEIKFPILPGSAELKPQYQQIVELLTKSNAIATETDSPEAYLAAFAATAKQTGYREACEMLHERCGKSSAWQPVADHGFAVADAVLFATPPGCQENDIAELQNEIQQRGYHLVMGELWTPGEKGKMVLFPTADKFAVVAATGTEGVNDGVQTADVVAWLREMDPSNPFVLRYCGHDLIGGAFLGPLQGAKQLAKGIAEICPSSLADGAGSAQKRARALMKQRRFLMRWD
jgi:hypothetical protein